MQMAFTICEEFELAKTANVKLSNYKVDDQLTDASCEWRAILVVVTRKKKTATDSIANVVNRLSP